jgi:signal transduction histidine kinase
MNELDEHNSIIKSRIESQLKEMELKNENLGEFINLWNILQPGTLIYRVEANQVKDDSTYTIVKLNSYAPEKEEDRFRVLDTYINLNNEHYHISIETNVEEVDETLLAIAIVTFIFFGLLIVGFILLNKSISKNIWKPFNNTLEKLKQFDINKNQNLQFDTTEIEEFKELNKELTELIERSNQSFNSQKTFIENASHELQTPLAVLKSKIELLSQSDGLNESISNKIDAINNPLSRVIRINKNLLLLAKIENKQFSENVEVCIGELVDDNIILLQDYIEAKEISIQLVKKEDINIQCNKLLSEILLNNLFINAINNTDNKQFIQVELDKNKLTISNSGKQALLTDKLYQRFVNVDNESTNTGLGLSIIKEICNRYHWTITYEFKNSMHSFSILF